MLQLRWVRRRVGAQVLSHRSSASITDLCQRDRQEAAQAAAAAAAVSSSSSRRGLSGAAGAAWQQHGRAHAAAAAGPMPWLSSKEELLLLQEMWHFLGCWHAYVLDGACVAAWGKLEQVRANSSSSSMCVQVEALKQLTVDVVFVVCMCV
jgi:hypothetical protein